MNPRRRRNNRIRRAGRQPREAFIQEHAIALPLPEFWRQYHASRRRSEELDSLVRCLAASGETTAQTWAAKLMWGEGARGRARKRAWRKARVMLAQERAA